MSVQFAGLREPWFAAVRGVHDLAESHPVRPVHPPDTVQRSERYELFWSLSFDLTAASWARIGGFCTDYAG